MSRNQLDQATSPYLLLHKDNPVHWFAWGAEALAEAERRNKPILLSIGFTACHWCHVMAAESFADPETAALMNENFVNVLVDREERPDIDQLYQNASSAMGGRGGWPLTMILDPKGTPFFAGAYLPKESKGEQPAFRTVLTDIANAWRDQPGEVSTAVTRVSGQIHELWSRNMHGPFDGGALDMASLRIAQRFDLFFGGVTGPQKFASVPQLEVLWRAHLRSGAPQFLQLMSVALDHMLIGGLFDHIGGGFFRYCTDERWTTPNFEKMTNDNAQLLGLMTLVWQHNRNAICEERIQETVGWLMREMRIEDAFATSLDSDHEGEEGKYYLWSEAEIDAALMGTFVAKFKTVYNVQRDGNYLGKNILQR
ncbi:MAG: thioredoxin domain-containing protein, partial [Alphaproteobacteria bacterium]|nr:thioredoxin domain-containing protein [Alphaproteobacteria bacterium]